MNTYNGWTNYATWRVNLEIFDSMTLEHFGYSDVQESYDFDRLEDVLKEYAEEIIEMTSSPGLARDYALAFLSDVHWLQIAGNLIDDFEDKKEAA
jgi:predicted RNA-binding protein with EMAP domain